MGPPTTKDLELGGSDPPPTTKDLELGGVDPPPHDEGFRAGGGSTKSHPHRKKKSPTGAAIFLALKWKPVFGEQKNEENLCSKYF